MRPFSRAIGSCTSITSPSTLSACSGWRSSASRPAWMLAMSSRSASRCSMREAERWMVSTCLRERGSPPSRSSRSAAAIWMAASGFLRSCDTTARISSRMRMACWASSYAASSFSLVRSSWWVRSRTRVSSSNLDLRSASSAARRSVSVARDLAEADELAGRAPHRRDDDAGVELRAVLADPPALLLVPALARPRSPARAPGGAT